ncbi:hypothetical protein CRUP_026406 [Coryphaenoides rupestris]|nr:hypothetical protein CRUP_026406 [Coryphaenoides rupestris]
MDIVSIVGLTAGNLFATVMIGVAVFLVASHAKTLPTTSGSKRDSKPHLLPQDNRRNLNATYQELGKRADEYDKLR